MAGPASTKSSKNRNPAPVEGHSQELAQRPALSGPQVDILSLQRSAGNRAVSQLLESGAGNPERAGQGIPPIVQSVLNGSGQPLDPATRALMETQFHRDFSDVRVHIDGRAAESARAMHAGAYTVGRDLVFGPGRYAPDEPSGRMLLAHELAHVVQQAGRTRPEAGLAIASSGDRLEQAADATAAVIVLGATSTPALTAMTQLAQCSVEEELVREHTSWWQALNESALGTALLGHVRQGDYQFVHGVLDALGKTDRDDATVALMSQAGDPDLVRMSGSEGGRRLLDRLFDELTSGQLGEDEGVQANRIMMVKMRLISIEQYQQTREKVKTFPFRLPGLTVLSAAPIYATRRGGGKIWVKMPVYVLADRTFSDETKTLPTQLFSSGVELLENEIIAVKMYDLGGEIHIRPALYLVQLSNETTTTALQKMGEVAALGLTLGSGAAVGAGVRATFWARAVLWADRVATILGTVTSIIGEHRGWIIRRFGEPGKTFLSFVDWVNTAMLVYGGVRVATQMGKLVAGLKDAYRNWRSVARQAERELSQTERAAIQNVGDSTEELIDGFDEIQDAHKAAVTAEVEPKAAGKSTAPPKEAPAPGAAEADIPLESLQEGDVASWWNRPPPKESGYVAPQSRAVPLKELEAPLPLEPTAHPPTPDVQTERLRGLRTSGRQDKFAPGPQTGQRVAAGTLRESSEFEATAPPKPRGYKRITAKAPSREAQLAGLRLNDDQARKLLRKNLGPVPEGHQGHHAIPYEHRYHPVIEEATLDAGWDINGKLNGVDLPTNPAVKGAGNKAIHYGSHPKYSAVVKQRLDAIQEAGGTAEQKRAALEALSAELIDGLLTGMLKLQ